jgi:hypothetical protein
LGEPSGDDPPRTQDSFVAGPRVAKERWQNIGAALAPNRFRLARAGLQSPSNPNALQDELIRHLSKDRRMSGFDFGVQLLDADRMTYWGNRQDADFWIENASVEWNEAEAPFHKVARLTLLSNSQLHPDAGEAVYFDVTGPSTLDSTPLGSINRARGPA